MILTNLNDANNDDDDESVSPKLLPFIRQLNKNSIRKIPKWLSTVQYDWIHLEFRDNQRISLHPNEDEKRLPDCVVWLDPKIDVVPPKAFGCDVVVEPNNGFDCPNNEDDVVAVGCVVPEVQLLLLEVAMLSGTSRNNAKKRGEATGRTDISLSDNLTIDAIANESSWKQRKRHVKHFFKAHLGDHSTLNN